MGGWLAAARPVASPNFDQRPDHMVPELIVIHNISLPPDQFGGPCIEQFFGNCLNAEAHPFFAEISGLRVSAHFLIKREGELLQFVATDRRAWHAGVSNWRGRSRCNDFSIGIELEGTDSTPYTDAQYRQLSDLIVALRRHYPTLTGRGLAGHSDIAPGRKTDPGPAFDWQRLSATIAAVQQGEIA